MAVLPHGKGTVTVVEGGLEIHNDAGTNSNRNPFLTPFPDRESSKFTFTLGRA
jgi:hypothetical protein